MCSRVFALAALLVGSAHAFSLSWDLVIGADKQLKFYKNDILRHTQFVPSATAIIAVTSEPVHTRLLFADRTNERTMSIHSFELASKETRTVVTATPLGYFVRLAVDPATQLLFWNDEFGIRSTSLDPEHSNEAAEGKLIVSHKFVCRDIAVDSCGGYIYWVTDYEMGRARLDGSEREVVINIVIDFRRSLLIDQKTQKLYWTETHSRNNEVQVAVADFDGKNRKTLYVMNNATCTTSLVKVKEILYWQKFINMGHWSIDDMQSAGTWQLPITDKSDRMAKKVFYSTGRSDCWGCHNIAANFTLREQLHGVQQCDALRRLLPRAPPACAASACQHYCLHGDCSDSDGRPSCSCNKGYSGERCEVNVCQGYCLNGGVCSLNEEDEPACQCAAGYDGGRCEVSATTDNSCAPVTEEGISACYQYCLNDGECSLSDAGEPVCQCSADHEGDRCEVPVYNDFSFQLVATVLKGKPKVAVTVGKGVDSTCATVV
ncbi:hypothetical protein PYW07_011922 [Mythimna separata]|uniref:EGF-like domain-containing protein n=1 Tax=Mythimna separata TaxID=271217 RepID=A0AAD7Y7C0_MYTSE|nr:hypothetical protein PYW07_011922 [Mythimna separata]